jgi:non-heme chloroperoxidase
MSTITTQDGTQIYYKDWGAGQPVVFSHGWPLNSDSWEAQMFFLASHGFRAIAAAKLVKNATLKVYPGAPHGLTDTHKEQLNNDLLSFLKN